MKQTNKQANKKTDTEPKKRLTITIGLMLDYLVRYSSVNRKLSRTEIVTAMTAIADYCDEKNISYFDLDDIHFENIVYSLEKQQKYESSMSDSTVRRQVTRLLEDFVNKKFLFGTCIRISQENSASEKETSEKIDTNEQVYYAETLFDNTQINIIRDSLSVYSYAETDETRDMISKLNELTDVYNREEYDSRLVSATKYPGTYYKNLHEITKAFAKIKPMTEKTVLTRKQKELIAREYEDMYQKPVYKVKFKYCEYDEHKQLKIRVTKNGEERVVNPVKLMWVNGFYYLVTYSLDKQSRPHYLNYRVDRMKDVKCLEEKADFPDEFNPDKFNPNKFKYENPIMYYRQEKCDEIVIRCKKYVINNAIDTFGFGITIEKTDCDDEVIIRLKDVSSPGVKMWALEYGYAAEVVSPESVREEIAAEVKRLSERYLK